MGVWSCILVSWRLGVESRIAGLVLGDKGAMLNVGIHERGAVARARLFDVEGIMARVLGGSAAILLGGAGHMR